MSTTEYDGYAPVNSTMQNLEDIEDYSILENEEIHDQTEEYNGDEVEEYLEESSTDSDFNRPSKPYEQHSNKTKHSKFTDSADDLREMTKITKLNSKSKEHLSFDKNNNPNLKNYWSSCNSLNSYSDYEYNDMNTDLEDMFNKNKASRQNLKKMATSSVKNHGRILTTEDLSRIFEELNVIHNKLMVP